MLCAHYQLVERLWLCSELLPFSWVDGGASQAGYTSVMQSPLTVFARVSV